MKSNTEFRVDFFLKTTPMCRAVLGLALGLASASVAAQAPDQETGAANSGRKSSLEPGSIALTCPATPAGFSFDRAVGRLETAGEGAANATRAVLNPPHLGHAQLEAAFGAVQFVAAPFAAGYGALSAPHHKLPPDKLADAERDLTQALTAMAGQENLRDLVLKNPLEKGQPRLIPLGPGSPSNEACEAPSSILETRIEDLRLERTGKNDSSYALRIRAQARLTQVSDGKVLLERPYEFQSGKAMFVDWTRSGGVESVAQTGYRQMAEQIAGEFLTPAAEQPLLLGAGYRRAPVKATPKPAFALKRELAGAPALQLVSYQLSGEGKIEIYSDRRSPTLAVQSPLTKGEAISEAQEETEWAMDGLENDRNFVVQAVSCVAAVPVGLWKQTLGLVRGASGGVPEAEARLKAAANEAQPTERLAGEVARVLTPRTGVEVVLGRTPNPVVERAGNPDSREVIPVALDRGPQTVLRLRLVQTKLAGKQGINSPLALCLEAQAAVVRTEDGKEVYSCPVSYRSAEKHFKAWAAHDARLFHQELARGYQEMGRAIADQLVAKGLVPVGGRVHREVARN
jgi:hypothetical protein